MTRHFAIFLAFGALLFCTGCSSALYQSGTKVDRFRGQSVSHARGGMAASRAEVVQYFGAPAAAKSFAGPISVAQAKKRGLLQEGDLHGRNKELPAFAGGGRIAQVDEYRIKGATVAGSDLMLPDITLELAKYSLGLSELVFFPMAVYDYAGRLNNVTGVYFFYDRAGRLLGQTYPEKWERKNQPPSRLR